MLTHVHYGETLCGWQYRSKGEVIEFVEKDRVKREGPNPGLDWTGPWRGVSPALSPTRGARCLAAPGLGGVVASDRLGGVQSWHSIEHSAALCGGGSGLGLMVDSDQPLASNRGMASGALLRTEEARGSGPAVWR
jgi:hypothetical protein